MKLQEQKNAAYNNPPSHGARLIWICLPGLYQTVAEARSSLGRYFALYDQERLHQDLEYRTPAEVYGLAASPAVTLWTDIPNRVISPR